MKGIFFICLGLTVFMGCAKLEHLDQLLTLKDLSEEGDRLDKYVEAQNRKFDLLVEAIKSEKLRHYSHKNKILKAFGDPVYVEEITKDGQPVERWLYRYAKDFFNGEKVTIYIDENNKLMDWEYIPAAVVKLEDPKS